MIATIAGLPVFKALVTDDETGMMKISLVDDPAVMSNFLAFDADRVPVMYRIEDEERRLVFGVVMRADFPIYRRSPELGEYYVIYSAETIRRMAEKYLAEGRQNDVNTMHRPGSDVDGVNMVQYFIQDTARGIVPKGFDVADGSLFAEYHVENDDVWAQIKAGTYRGFSLEGVFDLVPDTDQEAVEQIVGDLDGKFSQTQSDMSKFARFKAALAKLLASFGNVATDKGVLAWDGDEDLKAGDAVFLEDQDGNRTEAPEGDYITSDAKTIRVAGGKVTEIVDPEAEVDTAFGRKSTDKGEIFWEGEEDLKAGDAVFVEREGERVPAEDGEYRTEDRKVIVVVDGTVSEIRDDEAEVAPESSAEVEQLRAQVAELKATVAELKTSFAALKAKPAAKPAHEEVNAGAARKTGVKGLDRLASLMSK